MSVLKFLEAFPSFQVLTIWEIQNFTAKQTFQRGKGILQCCNFNDLYEIRSWDPLLG